MAITLPPPPREKADPRQWEQWYETLYRYLNGYLGDVVSSTASSTPFPTTNQFGDLTSVPLTAGTWLITANALASLATATFSGGWIIGISTTSGNSSSGLTSGSNRLEGAPPDNTYNTSLTIAPFEVEVASDTTYYLKYLAAYSAGSPNALGRLTAWRIG